MIDASKSSQDEPSQRSRTAKLADMREALEQTVSAQDFTSAAMKSLAENMAERGDRVSYALVRNLLDTIEEEQFGTETDFRLETSEVSLAEGASDDRYPIGGEEGAGRYRVLGHLGSGAAGQVFEVDDANFDRHIAVKFLHPDAAQRQDRMFDFINEARLTAHLEHPNILPIHDINISDSGMLYFSMQKAKGKSLKELLDDAELNGYLGKEIRDINDRVTILIKVCEAIAYAHSRNIVHQDIKPSNIMIGEYGEVVLVDWGTAARIEELGSGRGELVGTPIYMSPEQSKREPTNIPSDIYCLGSTLFHILLLRFPTWSDDVDTFWELKRKGSINPITRAERAKIPGPLLSIVLKAMAVDPQSRYASVEDLQDDLQRFQLGQRVLAHRDSLADKGRRLYRRNRRAVWVAGIGAVFVCVLGILLYREWLKSTSEWNLYFSEDFSKTEEHDFASNWSLIGFRRFSEKTIEQVPIQFGEAWRLENEALHFTKTGFGDLMLNLSWQGHVPGDMRLEFDFWSTKPAQVMRCFIAGPNRFKGYHLHAEGGKSSCRFYVTRESKTLDDEGNVSKLDEWQRGALADRRVPWTMEANKVYHYIYERSGNRVRLLINNKEIFDVFDVDVLSGPGYQQFGFEMPSSGVAIDNIKVYNRPLAQLVSPLAVADAYFKSGDYEQAARYYETLKDAYPGSDVEAQSLYRLGRCALVAEDYLRASNFFQTFLSNYPDHRLKNYVLYEMGRSYLMRENFTRARQWLHQISSSAEERVRSLTLSAVMHYYLRPYKDLSRHNPYQLKEPEKVWDEGFDMLAYLQLLEKEWHEWSDRLQIPISGVHAVHMSIPYMYIRLGKFDYVLQEYGPEKSPVHWPTREVLAILGRSEEMLELYKDDEDMVANTYLGLGRIEDYRAFMGDKTNWFTYYMRKGDIEKAKEYIGNSNSNLVDYLMKTEQYDKVISSYSNHDWQYLCALMATGQAAVIEFKSSTVYPRLVSKAYILSGREDSVLQRFHYTSPSHILARTSLIVKDARAGQWDAVEAALHQRDAQAFDYWLTNCRECSFDKFVFPALMRFCQNGNREQATSALRAVLEDPINKRVIHIRRQVEWLLNGVEEVPREPGSAACFYAMKLELDGKPAKECLEAYRLAISDSRPYHINGVHLFVQWRIDVLSKQ